MMEGYSRVATEREGRTGQLVAEPRAIHFGRTRSGNVSPSNTPDTDCMNHGNKKGIRGRTRCRAPQKTEEGDVEYCECNEDVTAELDLVFGDSAASIGVEVANRGGDHGAYGHEDSPDQERLDRDQLGKLYGMRERGSRTLRRPTCSIVHIAGRTMARETPPRWLESL